MSTHTAEQQQNTQRDSDMLYTSFLILSVGLFFRFAALVVPPQTGELYNVLACVSALMLIIINYPKFILRVKTIYKNYTHKKAVKKRRG